jgi:hypothetical protein
MFWSNEHSRAGRIGSNQADTILPTCVFGLSMTSRFFLQIALQLLYHLSKVPQLVELLGTTLLAITELTVGILTGLFININILLGKDL